MKYTKCKICYSKKLYFNEYCYDCFCKEFKCKSCGEPLDEFAAYCAKVNEVGKWMKDSYVVDAAHSNYLCSMCKADGVGLIKKYKL